MESFPPYFEFLERLERLELLERLEPKLFHAHASRARSLKFSKRQNEIGYPLTLELGYRVGGKSYVRENRRSQYVLEPS